MLMPYALRRYVERMKHTAVMLFSSLFLLVVHCPIARCIWAGPGGFLFDLGVLDFAGGLVVHTCSGVAGLIVAVCIGPRTGWRQGIPQAPHSLVMAHIGASLLWCGWFGFNAGSASAANGQAGQAMLVTQARGCRLWMAGAYGRSRRLQAPPAFSPGPPASTLSTRSRRRSA